MEKMSETECADFVDGALRLLGNSFDNLIKAKSTVKILPFIFVFSYQPLFLSLFLACCDQQCPGDKILISLSNKSKQQ